MKNFKKIALALIVGAMAVGFSAFTNNKTKPNLSERFWTNDGTNYNLVSSYELANCSGSSTTPCVVESTDNMAPNQFPIADRSEYSATGVSGATDAIYGD